MSFIVVNKYTCDTCGNSEISESLNPPNTWSGIMRGNASFTGKELQFSSESLKIHTCSDGCRAAMNTHLELANAAYIKTLGARLKKSSTLTSV